MCTARTARLPIYAYLLCTSVLAIWRCVAAGTAAPTRNLTIVVVCHEALITFTPASLQPCDGCFGAVHNLLVWKQNDMLHYYCCITVVQQTFEANM